MVLRNVVLSHLTWPKFGGDFKYNCGLLCKTKDRTAAQSLVRLRTDTTSKHAKTSSQKGKQSHETKGNHSYPSPTIRCSAKTIHFVRNCPVDCRSYNKATATREAQKQAIHMPKIRRGRKLQDVFGWPDGRDRHRKEHCFEHVQDVGGTCYWRGPDCKRW